MAKRKTEPVYLRLKTEIKSDLIKLAKVKNESVNIYCENNLKSTIEKEMKTVLEIPVGHFFTYITDMGFADFCRLDPKKNEGKNAICQKNREGTFQKGKACFIPWDEKVIPVINFESNIIQNEKK